MKTTIQMIADRVTVQNTLGASVEELLNGMKAIYAEIIETGHEELSKDHQGLTAKQHIQKVWDDLDRGSLEMYNAVFANTPTYTAARAAGPADTPEGVKTAASEGDPDAPATHGDDVARHGSPNTSDGPSEGKVDSTNMTDEQKAYQAKLQEPSNANHVGVDSNSSHDGASTTAQEALAQQNRVDNKSQDNPSAEQHLVASDNSDAMPPAPDSQTHDAEPKKEDLHNAQDTKTLGA